MVKGQLPFIGICNFVAKRDNSDRENLVPIERATTWRNVQRRRTQSRQVTILPTVDELQEAEGHPLENIQEPEQINRPNCKKVHLAFLPDKYEPLVECAAESANEESRADKKYKRKQKLKKCRKVSKESVQNINPLTIRNQHSGARVSVQVSWNDVYTNKLLHYLLVKHPSLN